MKNRCPDRHLNLTLPPSLPPSRWTLRASICMPLDTTLSRRPTSPSTAWMLKVSPSLPPSPPLSPPPPTFPFFLHSSSPSFLLNYYFQDPYRQGRSSSTSRVQQALHDPQYHHNSPLPLPPSLPPTLPPSPTQARKKQPCQSDSESPA